MLSTLDDEFYISYVIETLHYILVVLLVKVYRLANFLR